MPIETIDDIVEEVLNKMGVWGGHPEEEPDGECNCRCCQSSDLTERIRRAALIEVKLGLLGESGMEFPDGETGQEAPE